LPLRAIFFAAPSIFCARALRAWLELGHEVTALVHPRRAEARGGALAWLAPQWSVGATLAHYRIPTHSVSGRDDLAQALPAADLAISVGFPFRIPMQQVRALPRGGVNLHPALLPAFRGPRPITALCLEGAASRHGGVSLHQLEAEFDAGPLIAQETVPFRGDFDGWMLELARAHARLMQPLARYLEGRLEPVAQDESRASFQRPGRPRLSPQQTAEELARVCRTLGARRRLHLELGERRIAIRGYLGASPRSGAPARVRPFTVSFDAADARVRLARWLPGTRRWRDLRWLVRLARAPL
jgi:methionyl-tRNA formyltransferase